MPDSGEGAAKSALPSGAAGVVGNLMRVSHLTLEFVRRVAPAIFGVLFLVLAGGGLFAASAARPWNVFIILSGSMAPTIPVGSLVVVDARDSGAAAYRLGDIVAFQSPRGIVTHRIAEIVPDGVRYKFRMKGDANPLADPAPVPADRLIGPVRSVVPYAGYVVHWLRTPLGFSLGVLLPATLIILGEIGRMRRALWALRDARLRKNAGSALLFLLFLAASAPLAADALLAGDVSVSRNRIQIAAPSPSPTPSPSPPVCGGDITIVQENANTGAGSHNVNDARVTQTCTIVRRQSVLVETDVRVDARTGGNTATGNTGDGRTSSGDADVSVSVSVTAPLPGS